MRMKQFLKENMCAKHRNFSEKSSFSPFIICWSKLHEAKNGDVGLVAKQIEGLWSEFLLFISWLLCLVISPLPPFSIAASLFHVPTAERPELPRACIDMHFDARFAPPIANPWPFFLYLLTPSWLKRFYSFVCYFFMIVIPPHGPRVSLKR